MQTTIIYQKSESPVLTTVSAGMAGYRMDLVVTETANITKKIFVMQREPAGSSDFVDTFYSVASVAQLESLPETADLDHPFYRVDTISLVFRTPDELVTYTAAILRLIEKLRQANDAILSMGAPETDATPANTLTRYWGLSVDGTITDQNLAAAPTDFIYSPVAVKTILNDSGPRRVFFACRADLAELTQFKVGGASLPFGKVTRAVTNQNGYVTNYAIYCTTNTVSGSTLSLETVA